MKAITIATAGFLALSLPAFAQRTPASNATSLGDATTSGNSAGAPSASTPAGEISTTGPGSTESSGTSPGWSNGRQFDHRHDNQVTFTRSCHRR